MTPRSDAARPPPMIQSSCSRIWPGRPGDVLLGSGILMPHVRNPVILAQQWATLHVASEGAPIMGVGTGAGAPTLLKREYQALAALRHDTSAGSAERSTKRAAAFFEETMEVIRRLWSEDKLSYSRRVLPLRRCHVGAGASLDAAAGADGRGNLFPVASRARRFIMAGRRNSPENTFLDRSSASWTTPTAGSPCISTPPNTKRNGPASWPMRPQGSPGKVFTKGFNCFVNVNEDRLSRATP